jgi:polyisoprenoid-binding protein YceI
MKKIIALCIAASFSSIAFAAPENYVLDTNHTKPRFEYSHFGYSTQMSRFDTLKGTITLDRAAHTGSADVTIDATSVDSGYPVFNGHLMGEDFFNTKEFPTITFKSDKFKFDGDKVVEVDGDLTIKGITGCADRNLYAVHAASDDEKGRLRRECHHQNQAFRIQYGQICALRE